MNWLHIQSELDLEKALASSDKVAIFKHSTRCPISSMAKHRLEISWKENLPHTSIYYLDLIRFRSISNLVAEKLDVPHQSPQLIVVENGSAIYNVSHSSISTKEIAKHI
ncbi:MAG: bacillithiol system redox-active protein YtxJ [Flavobacteriales bacterium]|nr:bacillithiol system redox-active protein YtxJ [Flavobacteriales bacterium]